MNFPLWFSNLLFWSAQVAVLTLVAGVLVRLLRIRRPEALLVQWRALIVISLLLPVLQPWHWQTVLAEPAAAPPVPFPHAAPAAMAPASAHWQFPSAAIIAEIVGIAILFGIVVRLTFFVLGLLKLRQLRNGSSAISAGAELTGVFEKARLLIGARAECRVSAQVESPVTFGFIAPVILLPERFSQLDPESQAAVLCHELLHVRRRDWLHHLAEEILRVWFWFHPGILWLVSRVRLSREQVVDEQVIKLTQARKSYVQALLEFTDRSAVAAVPAPLFLGERQLVERVSLMLKEVRMSRTRLIASLSAIACALALAGIFAVSVFPLKAAPAPPNASGPSGPAPSSSATKPVVNAKSIWLDTVKRGDMPVQVRGRATVIASKQARVSLPELMMIDVRVGQPASVDTRDKTVKARVSSVSPHVELGMRTADITLDSPLPKGTDLVDGMIQIRKLQNVVYVGLPEQVAHSKGPIVLPMFKVVDNGNAAERVNVRFDHASATTIEVLSGLAPGDTIILSNMSPYDGFARIQIKH
jgi:beta-lactamase regulating signal transducer with metallopeptidase domain